MAYYLHEVPGRLRVTFPELKRNPRSAENIEALLKNLPGMKSISTNMVTGSITVHYDPELANTGAIIHILASEGYIDVAKMNSNRPQKASSMGVVAQAASKALLGIVLDRALQGSPLSIVTAFI